MHPYLNLQSGSKAEGDFKTIKKNTFKVSFTKKDFKKFLLIFETQDSYKQKNLVENKQYFIKLYVASILPPGTY